MTGRRALIVIFAAALAVPTLAAAQHSAHGGGFSGSVSHGPVPSAGGRSGAPGRGVFYGGNRGAAHGPGPSPGMAQRPASPHYSVGGRSFQQRSAPQSGPRFGTYRTSPRYGAGGVQAPYRISPQYRVGPGVVQPQYRGIPQYRIGGQGRFSPQMAPGTTLRQHANRTYLQRRMQVLGVHHHRYRHRRHGYAYYYGGWWYASPWWLSAYSDYDYWSDVCASRWGYGTDRYNSCMNFYGFY